MASENGAGIVSNVGCDVNNTSERATESVASAAVSVTSSGTTSRPGVEEADRRAHDPARNSPRTPTGLPAASPSHANTEGHALRRDTGLASSSGDVADLVASSEPDNETHQPSLQRRSMSRHDSDLDDTACLPGEPDGNPLPYCLLSHVARTTCFHAADSSPIFVSLEMPRCAYPGSLTARCRGFAFRYSNI